MSQIKIIGTGCTQFGELYEESLMSLMREAIDGALREAKLQISEIDAVFIGNMLGGSHLGAQLSKEYGVTIPMYRLEAACASGSVAINSAYNYLRANPLANALVVGGEKMTDTSSKSISELLMQAADESEREAGLSFAGLYALMAEAYMQRYKITRDQLSHVACLMHKQACNNKKAQFQKEITTKQVSTSPLIAEPLRLLDCSPISDGAAAVVLSCKGIGPVVLDSILKSDSIALSDRDNIYSIPAAKLAMSEILKRNKVNINDIKVAEVHDCFSIALLMALDDLGFSEPGKSIQLVEEIYNNLSGFLLNSSGGLKACGHPVGATGVKQLVEIVNTLRINPNIKFGLTHNVGGTGGTVCLNLIKNADAN